MRNAFIGALMEIAAADERVWLLSGDLGFSVLEKFAAAFPARYVNCGVAEQNLTGLAAGLALAGKIVFTYSIANFPVIRCLEQVRNDVCYHNLNVKIVAVGGGMAYGPQGYTHHGVEDLAVTRVLPNMTVVAPGDPVEARLAARAVAMREGPCYLRLGKAGEPPVHRAEPVFTIGRAILLRDGVDVTLIATGGMLKIVMSAADALSGRGIQARVLSMHTIAPIDNDAVLAAARETGGVITIEEHGVGGLGSAVAEILAEAGAPVRFRAMRLRREPVMLAGTQDWLRGEHGMSLEAIIEQAVRLAMRARGESTG